MRERYAALPLDQIEADPLQPRHELESVDDPTMTEARTLRGLAQSIAEFGILQPIRVRRVSNDDGERYRIAVAYVGEDGIEPNVDYRVTDDGEFVRAQD